MQSIKFTAVFADSVKNQVLNPQGIEVSEAEVRMTLTSGQIVDLLEKLAAALPRCLELETKFPCEVSVLNERLQR